MATLHRTIVRPLVTEKTSAQYQSHGEYVFEVACDASKPAIQSAATQSQIRQNGGRNFLNKYLVNSQIDGCYEN